MELWDAASPVSNNHRRQVDAVPRSKRSDSEAQEDQTFCVFSILMLLASLNILAGIYTHFLDLEADLICI